MAAPPNVTTKAMNGKFLMVAIPCRVLGRRR